MPTSNISWPITHMSPPMTKAQKKIIALHLQIQSKRHERYTESFLLVGM
ncbi:hypothetical protein B4155_5602 [Bacillus cereus]|nr:hypothetical protein B4155_5602 [Bacillus cereus]